MSYFGIIGAILTTTAFLPQALKTIKTKETKDLSLSTFLLIFSGTICWCIYGIAISDLPLIVANSITAVLAGIIVFIKLQEGR
jgi:MtN3 and saliva related transmembrane protein